MYVYVCLSARLFVSVYVAVSVSVSVCVCVCVGGGGSRPTQLPPCLDIFLVTIMLFLWGIFQNMKKIVLRLVHKDHFIQISAYLIAQKMSLWVASRT